MLLHGLGSARSTWDPIIPALFNQCRVLAFDQRGHGESSHASGTYTLEHYVPDAIAFCETVTTRPVVLVGHSLGGVVAASVARTRPDLVRGLLLEDSPLYRGEPGEAEGNPFLAVFVLLHQLVSDMQARRAPLAEYEPSCALPQPQRRRIVRRRPRRGGHPGAGTGAGERRSRRIPRGCRRL